MIADSVGAALTIVAAGLRPFVGAEMRRCHGDRWESVARAGLLPHQATDQELDVTALLAILTNHWHRVFRPRLSQVDRVNACDLRDIRNRWAHQEPFSVADTERALDTAQRLLRAVGANEQLAELDRLRGVVRPGVTRLPAPPRAAASKPGRRAGTPAKRRPNTAGWSGAADDLIGAFVSRFGPTHRNFGGRGLGHAGTCDAVEGVQWNVWTEIDSGRAWMGVNLEGLQYNGWPIARFIERELRDPELPDMATRSPQSAVATLCLWRDCWQGAWRVEILESAIAPTPVTLRALTRGQWSTALVEAQSCLDFIRGYRGRNRQVVTLAGSQRREAKEVSPHLQFKVELQRPSPGEPWEPALEIGQTVLAPLHDFVARRSTP